MAASAATTATVLNMVLVVVEREETKFVIVRAGNNDLIVLEKVGSRFQCFQIFFSCENSLRAAFGVRGATGWSDPFRQSHCKWCATGNS